MSILDTADRIFELLDRSGMEQKKFAELIGSTDKVVSKWRTAGLKSYRKYLPQIAEVLDTSVEYLLTGEEKKPAPVPTDKDELVNAIIMGRDGKTIKRIYDQYQIEAVRKILDALPYKSEEEL